MYIERAGRYSKIPSSFKDAMKKFLAAKICLVLHIAISTYCYPAFCGTEEYAAHAFLWKVRYNKHNTLGCLLLPSYDRIKISLLYNMVPY